VERRNELLAEQTAGEYCLSMDLKILDPSGAVPSSELFPSAYPKGYYKGVSKKSGNEEKGNALGKEFRRARYEGT
jgi:hypothetical protein